MEFMELDDAQVANSVVLRIYRKTRMQQLENQVSLEFLGCFCLGLPHVLDAFWAVLEVRNC